MSEQQPADDPPPARDAATRDAATPHTAAPHTPAAGSGSHSLLQWALDVVVYAPAGAVLQAGEEFPALVAKGRDRFEQQVENARVVGRFVVEHGRRDLGRRLARAPRPTGTGRGAVASSDPDGDTGRSPGDDTGAGTAAAPAGPRPPGGGAGHRAPLYRLPSERAGTAAADAAIEGYDTLSASQVVRRLDGLGAEELRAVYRHEAATRNRRTILHRAQQLLGAGPPGAAGPRGAGGDGS